MSTANLQPPPSSADSLSSGGTQSPSNEIDASSVLIVLPTPEPEPDLQPFLPQDPSREPITITSIDSQGFDASESSISDNNEDDFLVNEDGYVYGGMEMDSERDVDLDEEHVIQIARLKSSSVPPLPPSKVFLYLLSPFLKLGAILAISFPPPSPSSGHDPDDDSGGSKDEDYHTRLASRRHEILGLLAFALLSAFTRHVWYMLARYIRRADLEQIIVEAVTRTNQPSSRDRRGGGSRKREKENTRKWVRYAVRFSVGVFRLLVVVVYLRGTFHYLSSHFLLQNSYHHTRVSVR